MMESTKIKIFLVIFVIALIFVRVLPTFFYKAGSAELNKGNCSKAYEYLRLAYHIYPINKDYRYYYTKSLICMPVDVDIQREIWKIADGKLDDSAETLAKNRIMEWRYQWNNGRNYIEQAPLNGGVVRWDLKKLPIKIYFTGEPGFIAPEYYQKATLKAFEQWEKSTGFLKFDNAAGEKDADIVVIVKPLPKNVCKAGICQYAVGVTDPVIKKQHLELMRITMYGNTPTGSFVGEQEFYSTILHEIGHALGIMGHSYNADDLMYMEPDSRNVYMNSRSSFQFLTQNDLNTIRLLYKLTPDVTNTPPALFDNSDLIYAPIILGSSTQVTDRKLREALHYIEHAPDMSGGYIDLGAAYAESERYDEAIEAFQKAFSLAKNNDEKYIAMYNTAATYLNKKEFDNALEYAQKARWYSDSAEIDDLVSAINRDSEKAQKLWSKNSK